MSSRNPLDAARRAAYRALRAVTADGAYANLALADALSRDGLTGRDAAFATELVSGACRWQGTWDRLIEVAGNRAISTLQPAVVDVLRLGAHQLFAMRVPSHAAVALSVELGRAVIGERVTGVVNAIMRRLAARDLDDWLDRVTTGLDARDALAVRTAHPRWIVDAIADVLPDDELIEVLTADNAPAAPTLAVRPGLLTRDALLAEDGGESTRFSPWGVRRPGDPGDVAAIRDGRAGVQDEGSQLVCLAAVRALDAVAGGTWLDLCAGPGGKAALLRGLAGERGTHLVAAEVQPHRVQLVRQALRAYPEDGHEVVCADGRDGPWRPGAFDLVVADVPCSGLGALRRRPEARWRRTPQDVADLVPLQRDLLAAALAAARPGGLVAYITCSPHAAETTGVVLPVARDAGAAILDAPSFLPEVPDAAARSDPRFVQLWPHRHGTDAMFLALLRPVSALCVH
ncbi:MAG: RsmB/NOP family class I SAM-dependent RNA methyltransferase [Actinomycetia bacterium]|nr:RsmB/NOP family class I SAM-dependent RNA methyltransferase [Actinomycetes bacterium]